MEIPVRAGKFRVYFLIWFASDWSTQQSLLSLYFEPFHNIFDEALIQCWYIIVVIRFPSLFRALYVEPKRTEHRVHGALRSPTLREGKEMGFPSSNDIDCSSCS